MYIPQSHSSELLDTFHQKDTSSVLKSIQDIHTPSVCRNFTSSVPGEIYSRTCGHFPLYSFVSFCLFLQAWNFFKNSLIFFFYVYGYFACRCLCIVHMQYLHMSGEANLSPETTVTDSYELLFVCCDLNFQGPLKEQHCS